MLHMWRVSLETFIEDMSEWTPAELRQKNVVERQQKAIQAYEKMIELKANKPDEIAKWQERIAIQESKIEWLEGYLVSDLEDNTEDDTDDEIDGFWYSDDEEIAGEPQFTLDLDTEYENYQEVFPEAYEETREEFEDRWQWVDADTIADDEQLRQNLRVTSDYIYDDRIVKFVETELAKYDTQDLDLDATDTYIRENNLSSDAGYLNLYMSKDYRAVAEHLAAQLEITDLRGNPSISALFRHLIDKELAR